MKLKSKTIKKSDVRRYVLEALNAYVSPDVDIADPATDKLTFDKAGLTGGRVNAYRVWFINQNLLQPNGAGDVAPSELTKKTKIIDLINLICALLEAAGYTII